MLCRMNQNRQESGNRQPALKKAYEISYAVFRIASRIGNVAFKEHLERQALSLLDAAAVENYAWVSIVSRAIEYLIRFGADVGFVHETNKEIILNELNAIAVDVAGSLKPGMIEPVSLGDIFSGQEPLFKSVSKFSGNPGSRQSAKIGNEVALNNPAIDPAKESGNTYAVDSMLGPETRQSAILQKLRESGNCRMRDLQSILPDYSERTLRYDLQSLTEKNIIERIGSGGPAVYYRIRQVV